jgi:hypothetical protein
MIAIFRGKTDKQNSTLADMKTTGLVQTRQQNGHDISGYQHKREKEENHKSEG